MLNYDTIVVGAGIIGLSTAFHIKRRNPQDRVLVIDKRSGPGQGNTAKSWAGFRNFFSSTTNLALAGSGIQFYRHVQEDLGVDLQMRWIGYLFLYSRTDYQKKMEILEGMAKRGAEYCVYEGNEITGRLGMNRKPRSEASQLMGLSDIDLGLFVPKAGTLDSDSLTKFYESEFTKLGGEIQYNTLAKSIIVEPKKPLGFPGEPYFWQDSRAGGVDTDKGTIKAKKTVVATGAWASELLDPIGIDAYSKPLKRNVFVIGADTQQLRGLLRAKGFSSQDCMPLTFVDCLPDAGVSFHILPRPKEDGFWASCTSPFVREFRLENEPMANKKVYEFGINWILPEYFPQFSNSRIRNSWGGQYEFNSLDGQPVIFEVNDLIVVGAASGSGLQKADAMGRIASSVYANEEYAELYGGEKVKVGDLSISHRKIDPETFVL